MNNWQGLYPLKNSNLKDEAIKAKINAQNGTNIDIDILKDRIDPTNTTINEEDIDKTKECIKIILFLCRLILLMMIEIAYYIKKRKKNGGKTRVQR